MEPFRFVIIGAGPSCTYVVERLAATADWISHPFALELHIFDKTGQFGAGQVHCATQPATSFLNRIAGQIGFGADESIEGAGPLLPKSLRPTLHQWCRAKFEETADHNFDLAPEDWPKRYIHGLALQDLFCRYLDLLKCHPSIHIQLHHREVIDIFETDESFEVVARPAMPERLRANHVLFLTGHSCNDPCRTPVLRRWLDFARTHAATYVPYAYPLEQTIAGEAVTPDRVVGCVGMGLTAIDLILYLTEGRGGHFDTEACGRLVYRPSGAEPASIVAFGSTGLFTFARPYNAKEKGSRQLQHRGLFLTKEAIDRLRASVGIPIEISQIGVQRQLDFEQHVFPLVLLEMAYVYYKTFLGNDFAQSVAGRVFPTYDAFIADGGGDAEPAQLITSLLAPLNAAVDEAAILIDGILSGQVAYTDAVRSERPWSIDAALSRYLDVVFGTTGRERVTASLAIPDQVKVLVAELRSPWGHATRLGSNRFSWERLIHPIPATDCASPHGYRNAMLAFMTRDHLWAAQNNLENPAKAAADGVWRDLRPVLAHVVDFGGLTAASHRTFLTTYMRYHNRLANGAALEIMEKIRALVEHGLLDVSIGPHPMVDVNKPHGRFRVYGRLTKAERFIDTLVDAKVHPFDPEVDILPLYRNLFRRGLIKKWRNPSSDGHYFEPGGLDLTTDFHAVRGDGTIDTRMTFLGPPTEGVMFFQLGALRPNQNHHVMQDVLCWLRGFWKAIADHAAQQSANCGIDVSDRLTSTKGEYSSV